MGEGSSHTNQLNLLPIILNGVVTVVLIQLILWGIHKSIYIKIPTHKLTKFFILWLLSIGILGLFVGIQFIQPKAWMIPIRLPIFIAIIIVCLVIFTGITFFGKKERRVFLKAWLPFIWANGIFGILQSINPTRKLFSQHVGWFIAALVLSMLWFCLVMFLESKRKK